MAKRRTAKGSARARKASGRKGTSSANLDRLLKAKAIDPSFANALSPAAMTKIDKLTSNEVKALISAHKKVSPRRRWQPNPDGSIF
jgi:hypothetical protein